MEEQKKNEIIRQANPLTESRQEFSRIEKNAYYCVVWQVRRDYIDKGSTDYPDMVVEIPESRLIDIGGKWHKNDAQEALMNLRKRDITIEQKDGSWMNCGFVNWSEYDAKKNVYRLQVSSKIMPYLVELSKKYTEYSLTVAISLKSVYSQRLYELCSQYKNTKKKTFFKMVSDLRTMFGCEKTYPNLSNFERKTIAKAQTELRKLFDAGQCDLYFDYLKEGRGEEAKYTFRIHFDGEEESAEEEAITLLNKAKGIYSVLLGIFPKDKKYAKRVYDFLCYHVEEISSVYDTLESLLKRYKKPDIAPVVRVVFEREKGIK